MSYKPLKEEEAGLTKQPCNTLKSPPPTAQFPRHMISSSLILAVISYCCCAGLGIIPVILVVFAYVKRETGKFQEAKRLSKYSRVISTILIILSIILLTLFIAHCVVMAIYGKHIRHKKEMRPYGNDAIEAPREHYNEWDVDVEYQVDDVEDTDSDSDGDISDSDDETEQTLGGDSVDDDVYDMLNPSNDEETDDDKGE